MLIVMLLGTECLEDIVVGVSNRKLPNEDDLILCAENEKCVLEDRVPRWLKLRCRSPVEGKYLFILRTRRPSVPLSIAEIRVIDVHDILVDMRPGGIYLYDIYKFNHIINILIFVLSIKISRKTR